MAPAARKAPQDHKAKGSKMEQVKTIDFEGVTYTLNLEAADDEEVLDLLMTVDSDPRAAFEAARRVLGDDQWDAWRESARTKDGRVPLSEKVRFAKAVVEPLGNFYGSLLS